MLKRLDVGAQFPKIGVFLYTENGLTCLMVRFPYFIAKRWFRLIYQIGYTFDWSMLICEVRLGKHMFVWDRHTKPRWISQFRFWTLCRNKVDAADIVSDLPVAQ